MTFRNIVVATDFSAGAESAVRFAMHLADRCSAGVMIAHAWEGPTGLVGVLPVPADVVEESRADAARI